MDNEKADLTLSLIFLSLSLLHFAVVSNENSFKMRPPHRSCSTRVARKGDTKVTLSGEETRETRSRREEEEEELAVCVTNSQ